MTNSIDLKGNWMEHSVIHFNGEKGIRYLNAKLKIPSGPWNKIVYGPSLAYIPEKDRLLMSVHSEGREDGLEQHSFLSKSDDRGVTWSEPEYIHKDKNGMPDCGAGIVLSYLGNGKMIFFAGFTDGRQLVWYSYDYGETWEEHKTWEPGLHGNPFYTWGQIALDWDHSTGWNKGIILGGYTSFQGVSHGGIRISYDEGKTWDKMEIPQWIGINEVALVKARNGDLVAALRTDGPWRFSDYFDHTSGLGISISTDNGYTWSEVKMLYEWGRHHPSMVLMPNGRLILTYVVRLGYPNTGEGIPQWGIEAVESNDNGRTWDLDHRYVLTKWQGAWRGPNSWIGGSQQTSSLLMPDGKVYTAFGTGEGAKTKKGPLWRSAMNIGLISWTPDREGSDNENRITLSPYDSELRNNFDPDPKGEKHLPGITGSCNIALKELGATVRTSDTDSRIEDVLYDRFARPPIVMETIPAWIEISWPVEHYIRQVRILPGLPGMARKQKTACTPREYVIEYLKDNEWATLTPPVKNAQTASEFEEEQGVIYLCSEKEFEYVHTFLPVNTKAIRIYITRSSDEGIRAVIEKDFLVPSNKRKTIIREIEVLEVGR